MRDRKASLPLAGMFEVFSAGGAKNFECTIDRFCRTQVCEFPGSVFALEASSPPHVIYEKGHFRATITNGPQMFLNDSGFSPHYSASYSLRKGIEVLQSKTATERGQGHRRLFVVIEEYKTIQPTDMHQGECVVVDQGLLKGGTSGAEAILALRTMDGAWPDETADLVSENIVLGAIKAVQNITHGMKALLDQTNYLERGGRIVHIQEAYADFAFGGLRGERALDGDALREKADDVRNSIVALCSRMQHPNMSELITALRLQDTNDRKYLCLWYLRLWEAACAAGAQFGDTQFGNPEGARDGRGRRREQLDHRNDIAHGRTDEIDYRIFDHLQTDIQNSLRKNVFR